MTPYAPLNETYSPLSIITAASLADLGYTVDLGSRAIDPFDAQKAIKTGAGRMGGGERKMLENCIHERVPIKRVTPKDGPSPLK